MEVNDYRLNDAKGSMCHVVIKRFTDSGEDGSITVELWSYYTNVMRITYTVPDECYTAFARGTFSTSTGRHINRFTNEFLGDNLYFHVKDACGKDCGRLKCVLSVGKTNNAKAKQYFTRALANYSSSGKRFHDYTKSEIERFNANRWYY